jgi:hypothetical protein
MSTKRYDSIGTALAQPSAEPILGRGERMSREAPMHELNLMSHWALPLLRAATPAFLLATLLAVSLACFQIPNWIIAVAWSFAFLIVSILRWKPESALVMDMVWSIEERTGQDLNLDGVVGRPTGPLVINARRGQVVAQAQVDNERVEALRMFVTGCYEVLEDGKRRGNTEDVWCPHLLSHDEYVTIRDALIRGGYATWRGPRHQSGWDFLANQTADSIIDQACADLPELVATMHGQVSR